MARPVVETPFFRVGEDGVRCGGFLELFLGRLVAGIAVRVVFQGQLAIRAFDLGLAGRPSHGEYFVVVALAHDFATLTIEGRNRRSPIVYPRRNSSVISPSRCPSLGSWSTAWWILGSKSAPTASMGRTPYFCKRSWSFWR